MGRELHEESRKAEEDDRQRDQGDQDPRNPRGEHREPVQIRTEIILAA
ncbi:MAG TPA: hypothetical protein VNB93_05295 [Rubrobacter sp.]|nr:hypothetical protein [Rubrobacter sp.]